MSGGSEAPPPPPHLKMAPEKFVALQGPRQGVNTDSIPRPPPNRPPDTDTDIGPTRRVLEQAGIRVCCFRQAQGPTGPDGRGTVPTLAPQVGTVPIYGTVKDLGVLLGTTATPLPSLSRGPVPSHPSPSAAAGYEPRHSPKPPGRVTHPPPTFCLQNCDDSGLHAAEGAPGTRLWLPATHSPPTIAHPHCPGLTSH